MSSCPRCLLVPVSLLTTLILGLSTLGLTTLGLTTAGWAQAAHSEQVLIKPPLLRAIEPPAAEATASDLEARADGLLIA